MGIVVQTVNVFNQINGTLANVVVLRSKYKIQNSNRIFRINKVCLFLSHQLVLQDWFITILVVLITQILFDLKTVVYLKVAFHDF